MTIQRYRLTRTGWIGAILFVAPTPLAVWLSLPPKLTTGGAMFQKRLAEISGTIPTHGPSTFTLTALATMTLIGLVMVLIGREIYTY
ncbi:hypothetical protein DKP76_07095 [Falsochrobactrum shanghaiense]|uniref:Uncharacterized protein n=1 Tax=Falsochrobactrum shanghaiense TaxID=2201899 RepID=A0A316JHW2_9HYPH|nr:hypothetical protein DKP76_07095 [Falsochrobactrum shanghaiense]